MLCFRSIDYKTYERLLSKFYNSKGYVPECFQVLNGFRKQYSLRILISVWCKFLGRCGHCMYILGEIKSYNNFYRKVPWQFVFVKSYMATWRSVYRCMTLFLYTNLNGIICPYYMYFLLIIPPQYNIISVPCSQFAFPFENFLCSFRILKFY